MWAGMATIVLRARSSLPQRRLRPRPWRAHRSRLRAARHRRPAARPRRAAGRAGRPLRAIPSIPTSPGGRRLLVTAGIVAFALLLDRAGLIVAIIATVAHRRPAALRQHAGLDARLGTIARRVLLGPVRLFPEDLDPRLVVLRAAKHGAVRSTRLRLRARADAAEPAVLLPRRPASARWSASCPASGRSRPSRCCCRSRSRCRPSPR